MSTLKITIELDEKTAALIWANQWEKEPIEECVKRLCKIEACAYSTAFPKAAQSALEEFQKQSGVPRMTAAESQKTKFAPRDKLQAVPFHGNCNRWLLVTEDGIYVGEINCLVGERIARGLVDLWNRSLNQ